ncbi:PEGA domain-containing protein [Zhouia amylolytica]|uniref:PEGA domain-containing protein n=1 Tax=Zhouia amylolytica AD3 TaxID=1286632 RepID=W2UPA5_9FLAO|nr:PEGA domain-containing protein [Zhouia amylolytica]ETN95301.1 PEGA domain-containing protein [Zhouia amylolytica AD3]
MKKVINYKVALISVLFIYAMMINLGCNSIDESSAEETNKPDTSKFNLSVAAVEEGAAIYIDGVYTGKSTPANFLVSKGEHVIGVGLNTAKTYLRREVQVSSTTEQLVISLDEADLQQPKTWKVLFVGVNQVTTANGNCISSYSTEQLDLAYEFLKWSFEEKVEPYSYNTTNWEFYRSDITTDIVQLSNDHLINPEIFESKIIDIQKGDYDLIVSFFRGAQQDCFIADFIGIAWYDVTALSSESSYFTIRYYDDLEGAMITSKQNDPGMFIHEWLHTVAERFYPNRGYTMPTFKGQVVHAAERYGYSAPWMSWYEDIIAGKVKDGSSYVGIGPEAFLECTVREQAIGQCL